MTHRALRLTPLFALALCLAALGCSGSATTSAAKPADSPRAVLREAKGEMNVGEVDYGPKREYTFTVANTGGQPLTLALAKKSCTCADVEVSGSPVPPDGEGHVTVHWSPLPGTTGPQELTADVRTNDPQADTLHLKVTGSVKPVVRVVVEDKEDLTYVDFSPNDAPVLPGASLVRTVKVFSTALPAFDLSAACTEPGFDVTTTRLPAGAAVAGYTATSGYLVEVRSTDKLPPGYVQASLNLALSKLGDKEPDRTLGLRVYAVVGSGAFSVSPNTLLFHKPQATEEDTARVNVQFNFPSDKQSVKVLSVEPKFLKVDAPDNLGHGKWRVTAHIPADNPEAAKCQPDGFFEGQVLLKVEGVSKPVPIRVKWEPLEKK